MPLEAAPDNCHLVTNGYNVGVLRLRVWQSPDGAGNRLPVVSQPGVANGGDIDSLFLSDTKPDGVIARMWLFSCKRQPRSLVWAGLYLPFVIGRALESVGGCIR